MSNSNKQMDTIPIVTIDGPVASGKGTISVLVAKELQWNLLESGVFYRALAVLSEHNNLDISSDENIAKIVELTKDVNIKFKFSDKDNNYSLPLVYLNGEDMSSVIRSELCGSLASKISAYPTVRMALYQRQKDFKKAPGLVAEGRDMGTVVFPEAQYKFYLKASVKVRAQRRFEQLNSKNPHSKLSIEEIQSYIKERDFRDMSRDFSPLKPADDAFIIDTDNLTLEQVKDIIIKKIK